MAPNLVDKPLVRRYEFGIQQTTAYICWLQASRTSLANFRQITQINARS